MALAVQDAVTASPYDRYRPEWVPAEFSLLNMPGRDGAGNLVLATGEGEARRVLKLYRQRRGGRGRRLWTKLSNWAFEGKRGESPSARRETERLSLLLWRREGFGVCALLPEQPAPPWAGDTPYLWLEYVSGRTLFDALLDAELPAARKREAVERLARADRARHARAFDLGEPLLVQEHATVKHTWWADDDRLLTLDLENGYQPDYPLDDAIGQEVVGLLRSLWWFEEDEDCLRPGGLPRAYVDAYEDAEQLRRAVRGLLGGSLRWLAKRFGDRRRRARPKTAVAERLAALLGEA
ncbi:MAG: hypothetical protein D6731_17820 [Planctomycetota bacterium]|nr:MAG: hypothetical protein D6731_17820 [Planctomycetota bacterium]